MRILKREVQGLHEDELESATVEAQSEFTMDTSGRRVDQQTQIDALQQQICDIQCAAAMDTPNVKRWSVADLQPKQPPR